MRTACLRVVKNVDIRSLKTIYEVTKYCRLQIIVCANVVHGELYIKL
jgi:hypothetical protein